MRILAVDPGEKRIGIALSDPTGTLASPLLILNHVSRPIDAAAIAGIAREQNAERIIIGQALDEEGQPSFQGRRAGRLAEAIAGQTELPVELWDESTSTMQARAFQAEMGVSRKKRQGHIDDVAAAVILQSYLEAHRNALNSSTLKGLE